MSELSGLRPYQLDAIAALRREVAAGRRRVLLVAPTGSGKTLRPPVLSRAHQRRAARRCSWRISESWSARPAASSKRQGRMSA